MLDEADVALMTLATTHMFGRRNRGPGA
jgi:hypothetical protein